MPTANQARSVSLRGRPVTGPTLATGSGMPVAVSTLPPVHIDPVPPHLTRNTMMLSSLPSVSTDTDGITRQFYTNRNLPTRRLVLAL